MEPNAMPSLVFWQDHLQSTSGINKLQFGIIYGLIWGWFGYHSQSGDHLQYCVHYLYSFQDKNNVYTENPNFISLILYYWTDTFPLEYFVSTCGNHHALINVKPEGGGGGVGQTTGIWLWCISPGWGFWLDIMHLIFQFYKGEEK